MKSALSTRHRVGAVVVLIIATLVTASCSGGGSPLPQPPASSSGNSSSSAAPSSSASSSGFPSSGTTSSASSGPDGSCRANSSAASGKYCDTFSTASSGWTEDNKTNYYLNYDSYLGGTYRVGERTANTIDTTAPLDITKLSSDYSVQIDVDAAVGETSPSDGAFGILCWRHQADAGTHPEFIFYVFRDEADIALRGEDGAVHVIQSKKLGAGVLKTKGSVNHLSAECIQSPDSTGAVAAHMSLMINGTPTVSTVYGKSVKNYSWAVGSQVGVVAQGKGQDVFYDNFTVVSRCEGDFC